MIAGDINDARALARLAQELLYDVVAILGPVPVSLQSPAINDIADQEDGIGLVITEKIEQVIRLGGLRAEVHVRNE